MPNHSERHAQSFHTPEMGIVWIESRQCRGILIEMTNCGVARVSTTMWWWHDVKFYDLADIRHLNEEVQ